jgi:tetratricopeptide (TPR) repeat protein
MKTRYFNLLAVVTALMLGGGLERTAAAAGGGERLAGLTPVSEVYLGRHVLRLDEHKSTAAVLLAGKVFRDGIGVEANSSLIYALKGGYERLEVKAGIGPGGDGFYPDKTVHFAVYGDGKQLYLGGGRRYGDAPETISVPLAGVQKLQLSTRGELLEGSDPRAAFWVEGRLYKAGESSGAAAAGDAAAAGGAAAATGPAASGPTAGPAAKAADGKEMTLSAFGGEGLLPEEYRLLLEFIEDAGRPIGSEMLIIRNGPAAALDLAPDIRRAAGRSADPHLSSWNIKDFPISARTYRVTKMLHGVILAKPGFTMFEETAAEPALTRADRKKIKSFLNSLGAWDRGDLFALKKEGAEESVRNKRDKHALEVMKAHEPEAYAAFHAAPALNLLGVIEELAGGRAAVAVSVEKCKRGENRFCTDYVLQIPRARAQAMPAGVRVRLWLARGLPAAEPLAAIALGVLIFRRRRRLFKYYALFSALVPAFFAAERYTGGGRIFAEFLADTGLWHAPLLLLFLPLYAFMRPEYEPPRRAVWRWARAGLKWLALGSAWLVLLFFGFVAAYHSAMEPVVAEKVMEGPVEVNYVRKRPLMRAIEKIPGFEDNREGWAAKEDNKVTCYVSLSRIDELYRGIEKEWAAHAAGGDFKSRIIRGLFQGVPAGGRREYFADLHRRAVLARVLAQADALLRSPSADGEIGRKGGWAERETRARLAALRVSPYGLAALYPFEGQYELVKAGLTGRFLDYGDTGALEDIAALPAAEITRRAAEIYELKYGGTDPAYWEARARAAGSPEEKLRYYAWALEKWTYDYAKAAGGYVRKAGLYRAMGDIRLKKGDYAAAAGDYAKAAGTDREGYCGALLAEKSVPAYLKGKTAAPAARETYARVLAGCGQHYGYSDLEKADAYFEAAAGLAPDSANVFWKWGDAYVHHKKNEEALAVLNRGVGNNPSAAMYFNRGIFFQQAGDKENALRDLEKSVSLDPADRIARLRLARAYYETGRRGKALETAGGEAARLALSMTRRGEDDQSLKRYESAVEKYGAAIYFDPSYARAYYRRGEALNELGRYKEALADLKKAGALGLEDDGLQISLGFNYAKRRLYAEAEEAFTRAVELDGKSFWGYSNRAWVHLIQGRCGPALADLEKARSLDAGRSSLYANLAIYHWSCRRDKRKALESYEAAFAKGYEYKPQAMEPDVAALMKELYDAPEFAALVEKHRKKP